LGTAIYRKIYIEAADTIRFDMSISNRSIDIDNISRHHYARLTKEVEDRVPVDVLTQQSRYWHREHCADLRTCRPHTHTRMSL